MPFSDLHCHPSFWSFNKRDFRNPDNPQNHIWNIRYSRKDLKRLKKSKRATYAQSDFATLSKGDVRLVFASMYPIEKGFFMGNRHTGANADVVGGLLNQIAIGWPRGIRKALSIILSPFSKVLSLVINNQGWGRDMLQKMVMGFGKDRINHIQSDKYDYFEELQTEHAFYKQFEGREPQEPALPSTFKFRIAQNGNEVRQYIEQGQTVSVVMTIEGFHAICLESAQGTEDYLKLISNEVLKQRLDIIKDQWKIFFVTFSHHFSNHMAGHANSLPRLLQQIANPHPLKNEGFVPVLAEENLRYLLHINDQNEPLPVAGRRVLIDVKHFSARSRRDYYQRIVIPYNAKNPDTIPVIASHCGYYGPVDGFPLVNHDVLIAREERERDDSFDEGFYQWNINLCDEDIKVIVESEGLIGVSFDQRILGQKRTKKVSPRRATDLLVRNIVAMVVSASENVAIQPERIWNCLTIGTDFDGMIDPVDHFQTAAQFGTFKNRLLVVLESLVESRKKDLFLDANPFTPRQVVEMIGFDNAYNFTLKHFK